MTENSIDTSSSLISEENLQDAVESLLEENERLRSQSGTTPEKLTCFLNVTDDEKIDLNNLPDVYTLTNRLIMATGQWNGVFYPGEELENAMLKPEGYPLFLDHDDGTKTWVGDITNINWDKGREEMFGDVNIVDDRYAKAVAYGAKFGLSPTIDIDKRLENGVPTAREPQFKSWSFVLDPAVPMTMLNSKDKEQDELAKWTTAFINSLPNSSFALVKAEVKDKAADRALPYKDADGKIDPPHLRNALARINQVKGFTPAEMTAAKNKLLAAAKKVGITTKEEAKMEEEKKIDEQPQEEQPQEQAPEQPSTEEPVTEEASLEEEAPVEATKEEAPTEAATEEPASKELAEDVDDESDAMKELRAENEALKAEIKKLKEAQMEKELSEFVEKETEAYGEVKDFDPKARISELQNEATYLEAQRNLTRITSILGDGEAEKPAEETPEEPVEEAARQTVPSEQTLSKKEQKLTFRDMDHGMFQDMLSASGAKEAIK